MKIQEDICFHTKQKNILDDYFWRLLSDELIDDFPEEKLVDNELIQLNQFTGKNWFDFPFQVILCQIGKTACAFPLETVRAIFQVHEVTEILSNRKKFIIGVVCYQEKSVCLVDSDAFFSSGNSERKISKKEYCLVLNDKWGILLTEPPGLKTFFPNNLLWRKDKKNKLWLLGSSADGRCNIVDGDKLSEEFTRSFL